MVFRPIVTDLDNRSLSSHLSHALHQVYSILSYWMTTNQRYNHYCIQQFHCKEISSGNSDSKAWNLFVAIQNVRCTHRQVKHQQQGVSRRTSGLPPLPSAVSLLSPIRRNSLTRQHEACFMSFFRRFPFPTRCDLQPNSLSFYDLRLPFCLLSGPGPLPTEVFQRTRMRSSLSLPTQWRLA